MPDKILVKFETFIMPSDWELSHFKQDKPSCFKGALKCKKYRIIIEEVEESKETYIQRLTQLMEDLPQNDVLSLNSISNFCKRNQLLEICNGK